MAYAWRRRTAATSEDDLVAYEELLRRLVGRGGAQGGEAEAKLALYLVQEGRASEAKAMLRGMGCGWRLADCVLRYAEGDARGGGGDGQGQGEGRGNGEEVRSEGGDGDERGGGAEGVGIGVGTGVKRWVRAVDDALPASMMARLGACFGRESPFWAEHGYGVDGEGTGYFSYAHRLGEVLGDDGTGMGQILAWIHREVVCELCPGARGARFAEWWAHCRPHACGHQLHFDSDDEGRGGVRNPICSVVVYLSASSVGGPTLVTNQTLGSRGLAQHGWLVHPVRNRMCIFDGRVLHGVIPGRGVGPGGRRVTLMVAFWEDLVLREPNSKAPCASQPFPAGDNSGFSWPRLLERESGGYAPPPGLPAGAGAVADGEITPESLARVWESVDNPSMAVPVDSMPPYSQCFQGF